MKKFGLRAVQLDLARQMEPVDWIIRYIDFLAENGFNGLMLYLEDRIITPTNPYPAENEGYTIAEMKRIVAHAEERNIEIFPCVATLGHAERFLRHQALLHISEMRDGRPGRFGSMHQDCFCPSVPEFYPFITSYVREVAELFPSQYFHIGMDESWNFNRCELCRTKAPDFATEARLFLSHILKMHDFLKTLGKRTLVWADMFEIYEDILPDLPRDVILVDWQYQKDVRSHQAHFSNLKETRNFDLYRKLGFESLAAPADYTMSNVFSYMEYASEVPGVLGFLMTNWEKVDTYQDRLLPMMGWAGRVLNGEDREEAFQGMMKKLFADRDPVFAQALKSCLYSCYPLHYTVISEAGLFSRAFYGLDYGVYHSDRLNLAVMEAQPDSDSHPVISDLRNMLIEKIRAFELKELYLKALDFGLDEDLKQAVIAAGAEYVRCLRNQALQWPDRRPGITPNCIEGLVSGIEDSLKMYLERLEKGLFLKIRMTNGDWYGVPKLGISVHDAQGWRQIADAAYKPEDILTGMFEQFIPLPDSGTLPDGIRFEDHTYGGVAIAYAAVVRNGVTVKIPDAVLHAEGEVTDPEAVLDNDTKFLHLGTQSVLGIFERKPVRKISSVEISLRDSRI